MKKILLTCLLSSSLFAFQPGEVIFEPKIGTGINFVLDSDIFNAEGYTTYGLETYYKATPRTDVGLGIIYNEVSTTRKARNNSDADGYLKRVPVYLCAKVHLGNDWPINPYLKLIFGYQFMLDSEIEGYGDGRYYGGALGLDLLNFTAEVFITIDSNEEYTDVTDDTYRSALGYGMTLGYRF